MILGEVALSSMRIDLDTSSITISNTAIMHFILYDVDKDPETFYLSCYFEKSKFCQKGTDVHVFEFYREAEENIYPIKQDLYSFALIYYICKDVIRKPIEREDNKLEEKFIITNNYSIIQNFTDLEINTCRIEDRQVPLELEGDKNIKFHQIILNVDSMKKAEDAEVNKFEKFRKIETGQGLTEMEKALICGSNLIYNFLIIIIFLTLF